jgi:hypothetical protein
MVVLPVSGVEASLRCPAGHEDVLLCEAPRRDTALTLRLLSALATTGDGAPCWEELTVTDMQAMLLELRRLVFGDVVHGHTRCEAPRCRVRVDITFRLSDYLRHHAPRFPRQAEESGERGWYRLRNTAAVTFRLPRAADRLALQGRMRAEEALRERCIRPRTVSARLLARVVRAMEALAPSLADVIAGSCPECRAPIAVYFDPEEFTLQELGDVSGRVFEEIHLLASRYHWSEEQIMRLPGTRRAQFAELVRSDEGRG